MFLKVKGREGRLRAPSSGVWEVDSSKKKPAKSKESPSWSSRGGGEEVQSGTEKK